MKQRLSSWPRQAWHKVRDYVRHDLRDIVWPRGLEYPPGQEPPKPVQLTWREFFEAVKEGNAAYWATWRSDPEQHPGKVAEPEAGPEEPPIVEEVAGVARAGAQSLRPLLQDLYKTRARAYRDSLREFVVGYREGLAAVDEDAADKEQPGPDREAPSAGASKAARPAGDLTRPAAPRGSAQEPRVHDTGHTKVRAGEDESGRQGGGNLPPPPGRQTP